MLRKLVINIATFSILASCKAPQFREPVARLHWSFKFNGCFVQKYSLNQVRNLEEFYQVDDEMCEGITGFSPTTWAKYITPTGRELLQYGKDECEQK